KEAFVYSVTKGGWLLSPPPLVFLARYVAAYYLLNAALTHAFIA
ncbi:unnamed protein product, partial [marine sediment metagenome]